MDKYYSCTCPTCGKPKNGNYPHPNNAGKKVPDDLNAEAERIAKGLWDGTIKAGTIDPKLTKMVAEKMMQHVYQGYGQSLGEPDFGTPDDKMLRSLQNDVFHFSAAKNYQQLKSMSMALRDEKGKLREFADFKREAMKISDEYLGAHLRTEYNLAVASSQMAARWTEFQKNKAAMPLLQYQTVGDARVRDSHRALDGVTKDIDSPFWNIWYPPNGWNCRCDVIQLVTGVVTPNENINPPSDAPALFQQNMAKDGMVFPKGHPYYIGLPASVTRQAKEELIPKGRPVPNFSDNAEVMKKVTIKNSVRPETMAANNLTDTKLLNLTGGVPLKDFVSMPFEVAESWSGHFKADVIHTSVDFEKYTIVRQINLEKKIIYNDYMRVKVTDSGVGTSLFLNQVKEAKDLGFKQLQVWAAGGDDWGKNWDGYYRWARLGYTMDAEELPKFTQWLTKHGRTEKTLNELVATDEGLSYWKKHGYDWHGSFNLANGSKNIKLLKTYLAAKNIPFKL